MNLEKWHLIKDKVAEMTLRERAILATMSVVVVAVIWLQFIFGDYEKTQKKLARMKSSIASDTLSQSERLVELSELLAHDPNAELRKHREELDAKLFSLKQKIETRLSHLIAPEKMADVMRTVLSDYKGLRLMSAKNLPVEPLKIHAEEENNKGLDLSQSAGQSEAVIFAHGFEMELSGNYFQTLSFLQHLEKMSGFYWQALDYEVANYPNATITLQLNTLSLEEDWIGV